MNLTSVLAGVLLALPLAGSALAAQQDASQKIVVDAKKQSVDIKNNIVTFFDKVKVEQGSMRIEADQLEVHQYQDQGAERLVAIGKPAKFSQVMENGKPIHGQANRVEYILSARSITLTGDAMLKQEESEVRGEVISYDIANERLIAESGDAQGDRVRTIFLPEQLQELKSNTTDKLQPQAESPQPEPEADPQPAEQEDTP